MGGKHSDFLDEPDMFPQAVRAVREAHPLAFAFENVQGLTRAAFADYFDDILLRLEFPSLVASRRSNGATTWPACASGRTSRAPSASTASRSSW